MRGEACLFEGKCRLDGNEDEGGGMEARRGGQARARTWQAQAVRETSRGRIVLVPFREATTPLTTPSRLTLPPRALAF